MNLEQIVEAYKEAKRNKHNADMEYMQAKNALIGALRDGGIIPADLVENN